MIRKEEILREKKQEEEMLIRIQEEEKRSACLQKAIKEKELEMFGAITGVVPP